MSKEIPILFSTPMVQAILDGRKTQTRRVIKPRNESGLFQVGIDKKTKKVVSVWAVDDEESWQFDMSCPYGEPGDLLWVREPHFKWGHWSESEGEFTKTGKQKWKFWDVTGDVKYFDTPPDGFVSSGRPNGNNWYQRLGRFMFKKDARIWLEVTNVRVERLQEISEEDAVAEGIEPVESFDSGAGIYPGQKYKNYHTHGYTELTPIDSFKSLWYSINGEESWKENPWVWVLSFRVISTKCKPSL